MFHENDSDTEQNWTEPHDNSCVTDGCSISTGGIPLGGGEHPSVGGGGRGGGEARGGSI